MGYHLLADLTLVLHLLFITFTLFGGLLCLYHPYWAWLHIPATTWGIWVEWTGELCPLTPLENRFRILAGREGYHGGFIEHYLVPLIYPAGLTQSAQQLLGGVLLALNAAIYLYVIRTYKRRAKG